MWYNTFVIFIKELGLELINIDYIVFIDLTSSTIVALYINDILVTRLDYK